MMRAVEWVQKEQEPEAEHREEVAVDGTARGGGDYEVDNGECERRDEQADGIVNPQTAESGPTRARHQLRNKVAHRIGEQGEDQTPDDIPTGNVKIFQAA